MGCPRAGPEANLITPMDFVYIRLTTPHRTPPDYSQSFGYASLLRLRPWREWPLDTTFTPVTFEHPNAQLKGGAFVRVHSSNPGELPKTPRYDESIESSRLIVGVPVQKGIDISPPKAGELDVNAWLIAKAPYADAEILLEAVTMSIVARLNIECRDMLQPTGPITFRTLEHEYDALFPMPMKVVELASITDDGIGPGLMESVGRCIEAMGTTHRAETFSTAVLRYLQAQRQRDPVNSFIDYWLTCVLLSAHVKLRDEGRRIARVLAPHLKHVASEEQIFQGLTKPLDTLRNDILHGNIGALKDPNDASVAEQIATCLLIMRTGGTCKLDERVMERITRAKSTPRRGGARPMP